LVTTVRTPAWVARFERSCRRSARPAAQAQGDIGAGAKGRLQTAQALDAGLVGLVRHEDGDQAFGVVGEVCPFEVALGFARPTLAEAEQATQARIGGPVGRVDENTGPVSEIEAAADDQADVGDLRGLMGADNAGDRIAIDDRHRLNPAHVGLAEQLLW
jgi:hypothetical protein